MPTGCAAAGSAEEYLSCWRGPLELRLGKAVGKALAEQPKDPCTAVALELLRGASLGERAAALSAQAAAVQEDDPQDDSAGAAVAATAALLARLAEVASHAAAAAAAAASADRGGREEVVTSLREVLLGFPAAQAAAFSALESVVEAAAPSTRAGHLVALSELLPPPDDGGAWRSEWAELYAENLEQSGAARVSGVTRDAAWVAEHEPLSKWLSKLEGSDIAPLVALGAPRHEAEAYACLTSKRWALARRLRERDRRYAGSTFALCDAIVAQALRQGDAGDSDFAPTFTNLRGLNSLANSDPAWERLTVPDSTGFCGVCSSSLVAADFGTGASAFTSRGHAVYHRNAAGNVSFEPQDSPVVRFDSAPEDEHGLHCCVVIKPGIYAVFPPNTLFRLKRVEPPGWTAPNGVVVEQPLYVVSATYRPTRPLASLGADGGKLCVASGTLSYGGRQAFVEGLDGLLPTRPPLTMEMEFRRELEWSDWKGARYTLAEEWEYCLGESVERRDCTAGHRDCGRGGLRLDDYERLAEEYVSSRSPDAPLLSRDEVLAVRLYSGPAYQPINSYLRQVAALQGRHRAALASDPALTFAQTCRHLAAAVRKLAAVATADEVAAPLWRGVRGELPRSFWVADSQGMVVATETAFMSTSRNKATPLAYMGGGQNVLWKLHPRAESDVGLHMGADISMLSQFPGEAEVLFPPCTVLIVDSRRGGAKDDIISSEKQAGRLSRSSMGDWMAEEALEGDKSFLMVEAQPCFI